MKTNRKSDEDKKDKHDYDHELYLVDVQAMIQEVMHCLQVETLFNLGVRANYQVCHGYDDKHHLENYRPLNFLKNE